MRKWTVTVTCFTLCLGLVGLASGQFPPGGGRGIGGGGRMDPLQLLNNPSVKKELELSEEQLEKVPEAVLKALGDVLSETQLKRLKQIELQTRGAAAFTDEKVQDALKLTGDQRADIKTILEDSRKEARDLFSGNKGDFKGMQEKIEAQRKETQTKITGVLTADQKKAWRQMTGDAFKLERPTFGGGAGFGGQKRFGNKKTEDK